MKNLTVPLPLVAVAVLATGEIVSIASKPAGVLAQSRSSYNEGRDKWAYKGSKNPAS